MSRVFATDDVRRAVEAGVIERPAAEALLAYLEAEARNVVGTAQAPARARFDLVHMLWYLGALLIIGSMGLFTTLAFSALGGKVLIVVAIVYAAIFAFAGDYLWRKKGLTTPGGLLICVAVSMAALLIYGIQDAYVWDETKPGSVRDFYTWIKAGWLPMEIGTLAAACLALTRYRFPFLVAIIAVMLWFMSMDLAAWLAGDDRQSFTLQRQVSVWFGLCVLVVAFVVDHAQKRADFAYWLHIFGMITFWGGIVLKGGGTPTEKVLFGLLSIGLLIYSVFMNRRVYSVFGGLGLFMLLGDLSRDLFKDALLFPFVLTFIGLGVIGLGLLVLKYRAAVEARVEAMIPDALRSLRPPHARAGL